MFPERFNNKTNGVTPRRWLLLANPALAGTDHRGDRRRLDHGLVQLQKLKPLADDKAFATAFLQGQAARRRSRFADWLKATSGQIVDPETIFDCQIKRIHEYKRQLLNACASSCSITGSGRIRRCEMPPRTFFFAGKAAPAYQLAKVIIKFIKILLARSMAIRPCAGG